MSEENEQNKTIEHLGSEETLQFLIEADDDLIAVLDNNGNFKMLNQNGAKALGYSVQELTGKYFLDLIKTEAKEDLAVIIGNALGSDDLMEFETIFVDRFAAEVHYKMTAKTSRNGDGSFRGLLCIGKNLTKQKRLNDKVKELNEKLIEANRIISIERERAKSQITILEELNRLKSSFVSNVSHELRTPLASIVGFAETIASDTEMPKDMVLEFNNIILIEGKRLAKFIENILDFSKLEQGTEKITKSPCDLVEILFGLINTFNQQAVEKEITIDPEIPEAEIIIFVDKERITRALSNILSNAIKFTKAGGKVKIIAQDFLKEVEVVISDTGIGIPQKDLSNLFEKFNKLDRPGNQYPGAGMGLPAAKQIIDLHKGLIKIDSEANKGTSVIIRLPKK